MLQDWVSLPVEYTVYYWLYTVDSAVLIGYSLGFRDAFKKISGKEKCLSGDSCDYYALAMMQSAIYKNILFELSEYL